MVVNATGVLVGLKVPAGHKEGLSNKGLARWIWALKKYLSLSKDGLQHRQLIAWEESREDVKWNKDRSLVL